MPSGGTAVPGTAPVREAHRFDVHALERYLAGRLPGFAGPLEIRQFLGGQSNPTYHVRAASGDVRAPPEASREAPARPPMPSSGSSA